MVKRMLIGAAAGAGAVYLLDPDKGPDRRRHAVRLWADKKDELLQSAGRAAGKSSTPSWRSTDPNTATGDVSEHVVAG